MGSGGVCSHSTSTRWGDWAIFCVGNDPYREAAFTTWAAATGIKFKSLIGCYKGVTERSFLVSMEDFFEHIDTSEWIKDQESVLFIEPRRNADGVSLMLAKNAPIDATLYFTDGREGNLYHPLGEWVETTMEYAKTREAWTHDPRYGTWFVVKGTPAL